MERTMIDVNVPNFITVCLMAALGYLVFSLGAQALKRVGGDANAAANGAGY